eukprot:TRINITY_DN3602_c0_g2_i1.p1 TRINITY_DN3602_c0_g2~~TRINITY_DN3602_c0_g2_i1.p1  ORF type:complete len:754 (+),score=160.96 TRINITY_DN3602_c0_g2_i1:73-2334(+)
MPGRKRKREDAGPRGDELKKNLEGIRAAVDVEEFIAGLTKKAGHTMQIGGEGFWEVLQSMRKESGESITKEDVDRILWQAKRAKKGKPTETAPLSELIWLVKHHGVEKTAESRLAARSGLTKQSAGSEAFEKFYKDQKIVPEGEWDQFMDALKTPLPMALRLTTCRPYSYVIQSELKKLLADDTTGLTAMPWAGIDSESQDVSAVSCSHETFHNKDNQTMPSWCKEQNALGTASFQEAASLLPPLLLDVDHDHTILDMCSAPGSKLLQCVDIMYQKAEKAGVTVTGGILSNEIDKKKASQVIPARLKRTHTKNVVVLSSDARLFPKLYDRPSAEAPAKRLYFDRILADVPCSGDGTGRKDQSIWETWSTHYCLSLHVKQLQILLKGLDSLKEGGRLVYSTCSLNPLEDEAVVMAALRDMKDQVKLLPARIAGFKVQEGVRSWGVPDTEGKLHEKMNVEDKEMRDRGWTETMFPIEDEMASEAEKCARVLPHHNDTSGFFLAVFERTFVPEEVIPEPPRRTRTKTAEGEKKKDEKTVKSNTGLGGMRNAKMWYNLRSELDLAWQQVTNWFKLGETPTEKLNGQSLLIQMSEHDKSCKRHFFLTTPVAEQLLHALIPVTQCNNVKVEAVGTRLFTLVKGSYLKNRCPCSYRPAFEGASYLSTMASDKKVTFPPETFMKLLLDKQLVDSEVKPFLPPASETPEGHWVGPCIVGLASPANPAWSKVWLSCILLGTKLELQVEDHEREGLLALMKRVF